MARGWLRRSRSDISPSSAADGAPSNRQKRGDFHRLVTGGCSKRVTYKRRARQRLPQPLCRPAWLNLSSHLGCHRDGEPRVCCSAGGLVSSSGPSGFLTFHMLGAFISVGFAGFAGRSSPRSAPKLEGSGFCHVWDPVVFTYSASRAGETRSIACCRLFFRGVREGRDSPKEEPCV